MHIKTEHYIAAASVLIAVEFLARVDTFALSPYQRCKYELDWQIRQATRFLDEHVIPEKVKKARAVAFFEIRMKAREGLLIGRDIGALSALTLGILNKKEKSLSPHLIIDSALNATIGGYVGSKIGYIAGNIAGIYTGVIEGYRVLTRREETED